MAGVWKAEGEVMYTVVRFTGDPVLRDEIAQLGRAMNSLRANIFSGIRKRGDGFSCEICTDRSWEVHANEILRFVAEFSEFIQQAYQIGVSVTIDIAIEPEDRDSGSSVFVLGCSPILLSAMSSAGLRMEISIY